MLTSKTGLAALNAMPRDRVVPESDGPFGQIDGRPALPWEAWSIVPKLAQLWHEPEGDVAHRLEENFRSLVACP
jgi:TatD DNase family protein